MPILNPHATLVVKGNDTTMSIATERVEISHASRILNIDDVMLRHLVTAGVIAGNKHICDLSQAAAIVARLCVAQDSAAGQAIYVTEAAEKYDLERRSIYNWIRAGWIQVIQPEPLVQVDEGDLCVARELIALLGGRQSGRPVFPARPRKRAHSRRKRADATAGT
ncbi:hypothetical protein K2Z83_04535 [Oscillochloris sp. ZM17-4]|uniref:hypothetical protein n=1 Tax=Oscillochloris sp. ZM17-4 TaxID=2866714 RepID=UPI001C72FBD8|nr:hypothetical protein [Oscillochloris sp. ZM17-4]MBX0326948.1 hypothetical protein [Oscillochloris sp. ZM17-4]